MSLIPRRSPVRTIAWMARLAVAACPFTTREVHAEDELALTWQAEPSCPDADWAARRMRERLGRDVSNQATEVLRASAVLRRKAQGFALTLRTEQREQKGERSLEAESCEEVAEAAVLVIALAIDPEAVARNESQPAPSNQPKAAFDAERPPMFAPPRAPHPNADGPKPFLATRAELLVDWGNQPRLGLGPALTIAYDWLRLRAELGGFWLAPRTGSDAEAVGKVQVTLWALRSAVCAHLIGERTRLFFCAGAELGRIGGKGLGLAQSEQNHGRWRALTLGPRLAIRLTEQWALSAEVGAIVPIGRARFVSTDVEGNVKNTLYAPAYVSLRATLGPELRF